MSIERSRHVRTILLAGAGVAGALLAADVLTWRPLPDPRIEEVRLLNPGEPDGSRRPADLATPVRVAVTFSVAHPLDVARARTGMDYVAARLLACDAPDRDALEPAAQPNGYLGDDGRVARLPPVGDRARYRAVFDNRLGYRTSDGSGRFVPALGSDSLCFQLYGARMWWGRARSATVRLGL